MCRGQYNIGSNERATAKGIVFGLVRVTAGVDPVKADNVGMGRAGLGDAIDDFGGCCYYWWR